MGPATEPVAPPPTPRSPGIGFTSSQVIAPVGSPIQLHPFVSDSNGTRVPNPAVTWSSSDTLCAPIDSAGVILATCVTRSIVGAEFQGVSATVEVVITTDWGSQPLGSASGPGTAFASMLNRNDQAVGVLLVHPHGDCTGVTSPDCCDDCWPAWFFFRTEVIWVNGYAQVLNMMPYGLNNSGQVAGESSAGRAVIWANGVIQDLSSDNGLAVTINDHGDVAGVLFSGGLTDVIWPAGGGDPIPVPQLHLANELDSNGLYVGPKRVLNDVLDILNSDQRSDTAHAQLWPTAARTSGIGTILAALPGDIGTVAHDFNDAGLVVGASHGPQFSGSQAVLWRNGAPTPLPVPTGMISSATAINQAGDIVGWFSDSAGKSAYGVLWRSGSMINITWHVGGCQYPMDINDAGEILCNDRIVRPR